MSFSFFLKGRYVVRLGDQNSRDSLTQVTNDLGLFDIVIDDGGHTMKQQQNTMDVLWDRVAPCGVFLMEDLHTSVQREEWHHDHPVTTLDVIMGHQKSDLVDFEKIRAQAEAINIFRPSDDHITAAIHKRC
jgi:hypothetical protein